MTNLALFFGSYGLLLAVALVLAVTGGSAAASLLQVWATT